jgi:hypothetical protein
MPSSPRPIVGARASVCGSGRQHEPPSAACSPPPSPKLWIWREKAGATDVLDGTIRLGVAAASAQNTTDGGAASATFELVFLNPDGAAAGSWQVRGGAAGSGWRSVELAVRAAAAEVAIRLGEQPAIRGWLERAAAGRVDPTKE